MICNKCGYEWEARIDSPVSCPRCKVRFDYGEVKKGDNNDKEM